MIKMTKMELEFSYTCVDVGMVAVLYDGFTDSPQRQTVRSILKRARGPKSEHREMLREVVGLLAGQIAQRMQTRNPSSADHIICDQHLKEMFR
jgi:hypothetical protein